MGGTSFVIPSVFTAVDKFSGPMKGMGNAVQGFVSRSERLLGRANAAFIRLMSPITSINKMLMGLGYYVGLFTLVRILKNAIDIFADFQQANADLAVVMGVNVRENKALAFEARRIGLAYGEGATNVVKMQHALATLGFEQPDILKMGRPLITGSAALEGANPERLADTVGAVINTFDTLAASDTQHILDVMALSANRTALNFEKLATTLPIVSGPANAVGISFERVVALLGVLQNAGVHVATSATSLKNIFIDSAKKGHTYEQVLENIAKNSDKLVYANKKFGKRSVVSALALAAHFNDTKNGVVALTKEFENAKVGLTEVIAVERLNTFRGAQKLLSAAYQEFILSIEDGTGKYAGALTGLVKIATTMLLISSDSDQAREALSKMNSGIIETAQRWLSWIKIIGYYIAAMVVARLTLSAWNVALVTTTVIQRIWSISLGIAAVMGRLNIFSLRGNIVALRTLRLITMLTTGAQWSLNIAMYASPLIIFAIGVAGVIAVMSGLNGWLMKNVDSFNALTDASLEANDSIRKFYMNRFDDPIFKQLNPKAFEEFENQGRVDAVYNFEKGAFGQPIAVPVNPKAEQLESFRSATQQYNPARMDVYFNDDNGKVKSVKSSSEFITPIVGDTNSFQ